MALMDEHEFQKKSDAAFEALRKRLLEIGDANDFEVEGGSGKLEIEFEDDEGTRFVISPNAPVRADMDFGFDYEFQAGMVGDGGSVCAGEDRRELDPGDEPDFDGEIGDGDSGMSAMAHVCCWRGVYFGDCGERRGFARECERCGVCAANAGTCRGA